MTFSLFSVVLLLFIGTAVFVEVVRGIKRGFARALLGLAVVLLSIIGSLLVTKSMSTLVSKPLSTLLINYLTNEVSEIAEYRRLLPDVDIIAMTLVDMLLGPFLFMLLFMLLRLLLRILVSALTSWQAKPTAADPRRSAKHRALGAPREPAYEGKDSSWFRRHERPLGGVIGAVAGFLVSICVLCPLTGFLNVANTVYDGLNDMGIKWRQLRIDGEKLDRSLSPFLDDVMVKTVNGIGGQLMFDTAGSAQLDGHDIVLQDEVEACMVIIADANRVVKVLGRGGGSTEEQKAGLQTLGSHIDRSYMMCLVATDFVKGASERWVMRESFLTVRRPNCGEFVDPLMDEVLSFLYAAADADYVSTDLNTMLGIYFIALDSGLLQNPDIDSLMNMLDDGTVLNRIYAELEKNPRMSSLVKHLTESTMEMMARSIGSINLPDEQYDAFMGNLAEAVTLVNGMNKSDFAAQVDTMTNYAVHYANQYGVNLPSSVAQMGVTAMMEQFADKDQVTESEMKAYIDHYLNRGGDSESSAVPSDPIPSA